ncbi:MAG: NAD(P)H-quinone oxidoreductase [Parvularculaceae bacterium]|nr:NAD(P)H-quinone oxidoreductase [Parvularculaceae bacterium]
MRCIEIEGPGGPEVLRLAERPIPAPREGEVLIRVAAAGVNRPDVLQRRGLYPPPPGASDLPGLEVAGEITSLGAGVTRWRVGDVVSALLTGGGYAEFATAHESSCLPAPRGLSLLEAASLPETFFTVYANVFDDAALKPGETLLVHGGTSGIGVAAIGMAKATGAKVVATASSADKLKAIQALGADLALDYRDAGWTTAVTSFGGADVVLDMAGGDFLEKNIGCLKPFGRHVSIAFLRGPIGQMDIFAVMRKRLRLSGSTMKARDLADKARLAEGLKAQFWPLIEAGRITPVLDKVFPLAEAAAAHERMEKGAHTGKIVLKVQD